MKIKTFKLTTEKIDKSSRYIIAKGDGLELPIAKYGGERKYYVIPGLVMKPKTKKFWYIRWNTKNLSKVFGIKISISTAYLTGKETIPNLSNLTRHVPIAKWVRDLNDLAKGLKVNIRFE